MLHREKIAFLEKKQHHSKQILSLQHKNEKLIVDILKTRNALKEMEQKKYKLEGYEEQTRRLENELQQKSIEISRLQDANATLQTQCSMLRIKIEQIQKNSEEKLQWLQGMQKQLGHTFKSLAAESLQNNNETFMHLAQTTMEKFHNHSQMDLSSRQQAISHLVDPLYSSLQKVDERILQMEKDRDSIYVGLTEQIKNLAATHNQLHDETSNLIRALRTPTVRGRWGEIQLKRVVEIAGMIEYCDFVEQQSVMFEESNLRPDMIIRLPNEKKVIVDSKAPLLAYLEAIEMPDNELRIEKLKLHAKHVRNHISQLSSKGYWEQFKHTPEFVVLFIPGENFFSAALEQDRQLIEYAAQQNVVLATPTSLITLLRTISYGWRQEKITQHTQQISELGKTLYERLQIFVAYLHEMRKGLERSIDSYNKAVGSFENRVLVSARKFKDLGTNNEDIEILTAIDKYPRKPNDNQQTECKGKTMSDLKILDFAVIFRNVIDLGKPAWRDREDILREIKPVVVEENEIFKAINQVSDTVCSLSKKQMLRFELPEIEVVDVPKVYFFSDSDAVKAFQKHDKHTIQIYPSFHRSGTLTCNFHFRVEQECSVEEAIHSIRINLRTLIIKLPSEFIPYKDHFLCKDDKTRIIATDEGDFYLITTLKNYASNVIRPMLRHLWQKTIQSDVSLYRCVSSTLVQIYQTNPSYPSLDPLIQNYASELHAIGTMHKTYQKSDTASENFIHNLSSDEELGVFTFGLSDLIVFDDTYKEVTKALQERKKLKDFYSAVVYNTTHYGVLLEWLYLEKFIIDRYNRLLSRAIADENTSPSQMLSLQKQSMQDLIMYTAGITPYPSREEFLEKARLAHRVPELQEKIEKKRDLATDYVIQEYTLRTNKAIQLVNIFVSATAAFGLMEVILSISQQQTSKVFWGGITAAMFVGVLVFLSVSSKIILSKTRR